MPKSIERIRRQWQPDRVRVLLVGESPPKSGKFFYKAEKPTGLLRSTQDAFTLARRATPDEPEEFLEYFQRCECYLEDLCHIPMNKALGAKRRLEREKGVKRLKRDIERLKPKVVISIMRGVECHIAMASWQAGVRADRFYPLPFPSSGYQEEYVRGLAKILRKLDRERILL